MSLENSFLEIAVVVGSNGGIGKSIYDELCKDNKYDKVLGFHKKSQPAIDVCDENSVIEVADFLLKNKFKISFLINAVGYLHDDNFSPEKKVVDINKNYIEKSFAINTFSTALLLKHFTSIMVKEKRSLFVALSARVGSIEDNFLGGWYSYRASKAALNQIMKTVAIEFKRKKSKIIFLSLHPGTVDTKLSKPFSNKKKLFSPSFASVKIIETLNRVTLDSSGSLIDYDGKRIPF